MPRSAISSSGSIVSLRRRLSATRSRATWRFRCVMRSTGSRTITRSGRAHSLSSTKGERLAGVFGLERLGAPSAELRRMYVDAAYRRRGLARMMLEFAEQACREAGTPVLTLSTSELQQAALAFYRKFGYRLVCEETGAAQSNKTVGNIRRYHFERELGRG